MSVDTLTVTHHTKQCASGRDGRYIDQRMSNRMCTDPCLTLILLALEMSFSLFLLLVFNDLLDESDLRTDRHTSRQNKRTGT